MKKDACCVQEVGPQDPYAPVASVAPLETANTPQSFLGEERASPLPLRKKRTQTQLDFATVLP